MPEFSKHRCHPADGLVDVTLTYDEVGNMTSDGEDYDYEYDPFGRLRYVYKTGTSDVVAEYRYNGLNQRIASHFDVDEDGGALETAANGDPWWYFAYDGRWRMVARVVERDSSTPIIVEQWAYHHAGLVESGTSSYIDSVILRDRDTATTPDGVLDERVYYLQNWRADVVALITDTGNQVEQVRYEPYGSPVGLPAGDTAANGDVDAVDENQVTTWKNASTYDVRGDMDMDGDVDTADLDLVKASKDNGISLGIYVLSTVENRKGYAGYEALSELSESKWEWWNNVRSSKLGLWIQRFELDQTLARLHDPTPGLFPRPITWSMPPEYCGDILDGEDCYACCNRHLNENSQDPDWLEQCLGNCRNIPVGPAFVDPSLNTCHADIKPRNGVCPTGYTDHNIYCRNQLSGDLTISDICYKCTGSCAYGHCEVRFGILNFPNPNPNGPYQICQGPYCECDS